MLLIILAALHALQCGKKESKSSPAIITVAPEKPIVINTDIESPSIKAAWFKFDVTVDNKTEFPFEIIALEAEVTAMDASGQFSTTDVAWVPSSINFSNDVIICNYSTYGIYAVGEKKKLGYYDEAGIGCPTGSARFTSDGHPSGPSEKNFRYKVKLIPQGYFIDGNGDAEDRFEKFKLFYTQ